MTDYQLANLQVFLVEPSHTQQQIISHFLHACDINDITCLNTGAELFERLQHSRPDLIISSMYLPDMTGVELVTSLRKHDESYEMAFLLISSETNIKYLEPIRQAGAIAILPKPFTRQALETALHSTLEYVRPEKLNLTHLDIEDLSVLLVDDSEFSLKYLTRVFENIGVGQIVTAHDGKQGLQMFNQQYFDLVVTDYNMPQMDGLQLVDHIRNHSERGSVPILMVTSEQNESRLAAIEKSEVSAILDKPFEATSIKRLLINLLN
ncbi:response regulator [Methylomonas sp. EFPC1]|uniref:Response regulator n=1 Tax=Methylomonas defluvii TaxID=3045149 RepID=A0ABU4U8B5_9GAMM|nr:MULTISPECIES: response regulator [unclassified Methylomonas]MDX8125657.1 response regulator [Methylomonas sp. OY6]NOV31489.1 response regulator [Methylomonas sp. ZR1]PKD42254.1 response regulator [Methylomonas sp. Kb3]QBC25757.1 response regulator [Methylomonas sp. LW13]QSB01677.1 response regulator [Methylomonas sp. EFPC1]